MPTNTMPIRKIAAGSAAVMLTLAAAVAAIAVNLGTASGVDSPVGKLAATEPATVEEAPVPVTPSTIYVDIPGPMAQSSSGGGTAPTAGDPLATPGPSSVDDGSIVGSVDDSPDVSYDDSDDGSYEDEDEDHEEDEHEDEHEDVEDGSEDDD